MQLAGTVANLWQLPGHMGMTDYTPETWITGIQRRSRRQPANHPCAAAKDKGGIGQMRHVANALVQQYN